MIVIAYGANLDSQYGNPIETFAIVRSKLADKNIEIEAVSSLWDTSPVGTTEDQPSYTNAIIRVHTDKSPHDLLHTLFEIEAEIGRVRTTRNAPRPVDLDLIDYDGVVAADDPTLILPHPRMHERKFVLVPLAEIAPEWTHPLSSVKVGDLIVQASADQRIEKITE